MYMTLNVTVTACCLATETEHTVMQMLFNDTYFLFSISSLCQGAVVGLSGVDATGGFSGAAVGAAGVGEGSGGLSPIPSS